ncbi:MAG: MBL fold metallo-hydrolase [Candidatus Heimdallarchaeota archaeon]
MTAIRKPGKINDHTFLIDANMMGIPGILSIFLIDDDKTCLIDTGTHIEARKTLRKLKELNMFPPDIIILTHSHWDHVQAVPFLSQRAKKEGKEIEIFAAASAIPHLRDQSFNAVFETGPFNNIEDEIIPLKEGDSIELRNISLHIIETPGHMDDEIAILDEKNKNLFIGDLLGMKVTDTVFVPPFMPPRWDKTAYLKSVEKLKEIDYETLCLDHFGYFYGAEAKTILDESVQNCNQFWKSYEENVDHIDEVPYLIENVLEKHISKSDIQNFPEKLVQGVIYWLSQGFKIYKAL